MNYTHTIRVENCYHSGQTLEIQILCMFVLLTTHTHLKSKFVTRNLAKIEAAARYSYGWVSNYNPAD